MAKKSEAQIFLERVEVCDTIIENKLIEKQQWHDLARKLTANMGGERVQASGAKDKMAKAVERCVDMEEEIDKAVERLCAEKQKVINTIEKVYSPTEIKILHLRYIQYKRLIDIAKMLNREYTWVTTTHGRALKSVQNLLDKGVRQ